MNKTLTPSGSKPVPWLIVALVDGLRRNCGQQYGANGESAQSGLSACDQHNTDGILNLYDPATGQGAMTEVCLADRAANAPTMRLAA